MSKQEEEKFKAYLATLTDEQIYYFRRVDHPLTFLKKCNSSDVYSLLIEERYSRGLWVKNRHGYVMSINPLHENGNCLGCGEVFSRGEFTEHHH